MDDYGSDLYKLRWERFWTRQGNKMSTFRQYWRDWQSYADYCVANDYQTLTLDTADFYVDEIQHAVSANRARTHARAIKAFGKYWDYQHEEGDPFRKLQLPPEPAVQHAPMATEDDLQKLLEACTPSNAVVTRPWEVSRDKAIILTLAGTGMRRGEVANMKLTDLDLIGQRLKVPDTKTKTPREVYVPEKVVDALLRYLRSVEADRPEGVDEVWLGTHSFAPLSAGAISQMLRRRGADCGVDIGAHAFRRMMAGQWMAKGGSETGLMQQAGWRSTAMIMRYQKAVAQENALNEAQRLMEPPQ